MVAYVLRCEKTRGKCGLRRMLCYSIIDSIMGPSLLGRVARPNLKYRQFQMVDPPQTVCDS